MKSALDSVAGRLDDPAGVVAQGEAILADEKLWGTLSRSLAVFLTATSTELFVLPSAWMTRSLWGRTSSWASSCVA